MASDEGAPCLLVYCFRSPSDCGADIQAYTGNVLSTYCECVWLTLWGAAISFGSCCFVIASYIRNCIYLRFPVWGRVAYYSHMYIPCSCIQHYHKRPRPTKNLVVVMLGCCTARRAVQWSLLQRLSRVQLWVKGTVVPTGALVVSYRGAAFMLVYMMGMCQLQQLL